jgi:hypothetical protein
MTAPRIGVTGPAWLHITGKGDQLSAGLDILNPSICCGNGPPSDNPKRKPLLFEARIAMGPCRYPVVRFQSHALLGCAKKYAILFSGKEDEPAIREYTLMVFDRYSRRYLTQPEGKRAFC